MSDATPVSPEFVSLQRAVAGRYSLERELGRGGMGIVFLARDVALDRLVAIKLLPPALADDAELRTRFLREARTAAGLAHPHIVPIHAVEESNGLVFFVMGFVDGETLGSRVRGQGPLPASEAMRIATEVALALGHAHARGVIHRDVKPDNVLLERETGRALVTDFGIARVVESVDTPGSGEVRGTPQYMSPEQAMGGAVDGRSDLYSLGVTAFFAATGRLPFDSGTAAGFLTRHLTEAAPPLSRFAPNLPSRFAQAVDRCLRKDAADRFASAEDLVGELGAARGALVQVPAALVRFSEDARAVGVEVGTYVGSSAALIAVFETIKAIEGDFLGITTAIEVLGVAALVGLTASQLGQLVGQVRELKRAGYDHRALVAAFALQDREPAPETSPGRRRLEATLTAAAGLSVTAVGMAILRSGSEVMPVIGFALSVAAPALTVRRLWTRFGGTRLWRRLLAGRLGRLLFRVGGVGVKNVPALPAVGEHTEVALGRAAHALYEELPPAVRHTLGDVPALLARLESDARALRARAGDPGGERRLASAVAALETLRLDLLRLKVGAGTLDELTANVEAARRVGEEVDAALAATRELKSLAE